MSWMAKPERIHYRSFAASCTHVYRTIAVCNLLTLVTQCSVILPNIITSRNELRETFVVGGRGRFFVWTVDHQATDNQYLAINRIDIRRSDISLLQDKNSRARKRSCRKQ